MAEAPRPGGLYQSGDKYVDANGAQVSDAEAKKALRKDAAAEKAAGGGAASSKPKAADPKATAGGGAAGGGATDDDEGHTLRGTLPEDFPGRAQLEAAGVTTYGQLRKVKELTEVEGIGPATADKIVEALKA